MLKALINRLTGKKPKKPRQATLQLRIVPRAEHPISRQDISGGALKVLYRLHEAGFKAFLVGGGVRDLLVGLHPKDFDVATDATPEEVKRVFGGQCRLIGRRFRLAHVHMGREIIEVATFRAHHSAAEDTEGQTSEAGVILRDNVYGNQAEDAERRDFTANALYYNIADFSLYDYAGGLEDIQARRLRLIGDPETRYREDPVRMLRAVRLAAKLEFDIDPSAGEPLRQLGDLLDHCSSHRLYDEAQKMLGSGHAVRVLGLLEDYGLFGHLFPAVQLNPAQRELLMRAAESTDARIAQGKSVNPAFFFAVLLWQRVLQRHQELIDDDMPPVPALQLAASQVLDAQAGRTALPKLAAGTVREIWDLQFRLVAPPSRKVEFLLTHPRFRAAYDFLCLREAAGEDTGGWGDWWTHYQDAHPDEREALLRELERARQQAKAAGSGPKKKRRSPRKRKPGNPPA